MRLVSLLCVMLLGVSCSAQTLDLRNALPQWGTYTTDHHYLPDWQGEHLPTSGDHWIWKLDSLNWTFESEHSDTVWQHSKTIAPKDGGPFSIYRQRDQRHSFYHLNGDTLLQDSAWALIEGTTEIYDPPSPLCWHGQALGDSLQWLDLTAITARTTKFKATLTLITPWGELNDLIVFEDRFLDYITYRIHRRDDPVREIGRYEVQDGLYLNWLSDW